MYKAIAFRSEPQDGLYHQLLDLAATRCSSFSIVWAENGPLKLQRLEEIDSLLKDSLISEELIWQNHLGLRIIRSVYRISDNSLGALHQFNRLYLCESPNYPQDLVLYIDDNTPWLISDSHNKKAFIFTAPISIDVIRAELPNLDLQCNKPELVIDGKNFNSLDGFFREISDKLIPGVKWGHNLDAFNDILRGGFGLPEYGFVLVWQNSAESRERLGYAETIKQLETTKRLPHPARLGHTQEIDKAIDRARRGDGPTVFDWIVEIINGHEIIDLRLK